MFKKFGIGLTCFLIINMIAGIFCALYFTEKVDFAIASTLGYLQSMIWIIYIIYNHKNFR